MLSAVIVEKTQEERGEPSEEVLAQEARQQQGQAPNNSKHCLEHKLNVKETQEIPSKIVVLKS